MTEKRFEKRLNKGNIKFNTLNPVWDNEKQDAFNVFEMIDTMNELHEENEQLKDALNQRTDQCDKYYKENEQLKLSNRLLLEEMKEIRDKLTVYLEIRKGDLE